MKFKNIKNIFVLALILGFAVACGSKDSGTKDKKGDKLKVIAIVNGNLGDKSFFDSVNQGMKDAKDTLGYETKVVETGFDETKWEPALIDACEEDWDIIVAGTWQMTEYVEKAARDYPEKKFIVFDTTVDYSTGDFDNVYSITYKQNEGSFLAGALAAKESKSGNIGFVGGQDIPVINDFLVGYIEGAQYANKDIKVASAYIGNFSDTAKAKELAFAQINKGSDFVFPCASIAGNGTLEAVLEKKVAAIGVDSDQALLFEEAGNVPMADVIYTSVLKEVGNSIVRGLEMDKEGKLEWGKEEQLGIKEGGVSIAKNKYYTDNTSQETQDYIAKIEEEIKAGTIKVSSAFGMDNAKLNDLKNTVKP